MVKNGYNLEEKNGDQVGEMNGFNDLMSELELLEKKMMKVVADHQKMIEQINPEQKSSCINLLSYLALRSEDIRELQNRLHGFGLSSLASSESHISSQMNAILERLGKDRHSGGKNLYTYEEAFNDIGRKARFLFGQKAELTVPYIMVTLETEHASDHHRIKELLLAGMNVARINCAHDNEKIWAGMVEGIKKSSVETGLSCKIYMDLAGPKIRTFFHGKKSGGQKIEIKCGERIYLSDEKAIHHEKIVGCTIKGIVTQLKKGERVLFDDGSIECKVERVSKDGATLEVERISREKPYIKAEKGINFPDSKLTISSLTDFDQKCLPFICRNADLVGYSFVRTAKDLEILQSLIKGQSDKAPYVILKIETQEAVENLPALLIQGMRERTFGVMIARGDLAIEVGFERLSEVQEEILWISEAAHVPVIWATQVLDMMNKSGQATRSEITDATYSGLAECVMINKGKHTLEVIKTLKDILFRGGGHHLKKRYTFRPLNIARSYLSSAQQTKN